MCCPLSCNISFIHFIHSEGPGTVQQTQTADWQVNEVNIVVKCSNRSLSLKFKSSKSLCRDRKSVRAFHKDVYLVYLPVCSLHLSHTGVQGMST